MRSGGEDTASRHTCKAVQLHCVYGDAKWSGLVRFHNTVYSESEYFWIVYLTSPFTHACYCLWFLRRGRRERSTPLSKIMRSSHPYLEQSQGSAHHGVQWTGLTLEAPPSWSWSPPRQVSMTSTYIHLLHMQLPWTRLASHLTLQSISSLVLHAQLLPTPFQYITFNCFFSHLSQTCIVNTCTYALLTYEINEIDTTWCDYLWNSHSHSNHMSKPCCTGPSLGSLPSFDSQL